MAKATTTPLRRTLSTIFKFGVYGVLLGFVALAVAVGVAMSSLPSYAELVKRDDLGQMIRVRSADGTVIVSMGPSFGEWLTYDEIPDIMTEAMVAVEDRRFRYHPGVDPIGIVRGIAVSVAEGDRVEGVSTITQQLARNIFLTNKRDYGRKVREGILALALEGRFSKDQILELYLNRVYFGGGAYGIDAASRRFFGHSATDLSLSEAAIIAGLVKAPSNYAPTADAEAARHVHVDVVGREVGADALPEVGELGHAGLAPDGLRHDLDARPAQPGPPDPGRHDRDRHGTRRAVAAPGGDHRPGRRLGALRQVLPQQLPGSRGLPGGWRQSRPAICPAD